MKITDSDLKSELLIAIAISLLAVAFIVNPLIIGLIILKCNSRRE